MNIRFAGPLFPFLRLCPSFRRRALAVLCAGGVLAAGSGLNAARAAADDILSFPLALEGLWAMPGCGGDAKITMVFTRHFSMMGQGERYVVRAAPPIVPRGEVLEMRHAERPYQLKPVDAEHFLYHDEHLAMLGGPDMTDAFAQPQYRYTLIRYARCESLPDVSDVGLSALRRLDAVAAACAAEGAVAGPACRAAGFAAFDRDRNGALDARELAAAYAATMFLVAGTHCGVRYPGDSAVAGPAFAAAALAIADADGDGALGMKEIMERGAALAADPAVATYAGFLHMMSALIPSVPKAEAAEPPCPCAVSGSGMAAGDEAALPDSVVPLKKEPAVPARSSRPPSSPASPAGFPVSSPPPSPDTVPGP